MRSDSARGPYVPPPWRPGQLRQRLRHQDIAGMRTPRIDAEYWLSALAELESADLTHHEHAVLARLRDRLSPGEERDLVERLLELHAPRSP